MPQVNYLAVLVCAIVSMVIGALWYGPFFGKVWTAGMGWDPKNKEEMEKMKKSAAGSYAQMFVLALITAYVLANVEWAFHAAMPSFQGILLGLQTGFYTWLGYFLPVKYGDKLWGGKKFKYVSVDLGYYLVNLLIVGSILAIWK